MAEAIAKGKVTGTRLKVIAMVTMFIDHFAAIFIDNVLATLVPANVGTEAYDLYMTEHPQVALLGLLLGAMRGIGRCGFPLFAFLLTEGFEHTRSWLKYALNLAIFALISEIPFNLGFYSRVFAPFYQNVFMTLLLGLICMVLIKFLSERKPLKAAEPLFYLAAAILGLFTAYMVLKSENIRHFVTLSPKIFQFICLAATVVFALVAFFAGGRIGKESMWNFVSNVCPLMLCAYAADLLKTDYGAWGVVTIAVMYIFRKNRKTAFALGCTVLTLMYFIEAAAFFMLIPVSKYNGERGMKINKYVFYAFYPVHIGLLYILTYLLHFTTFSVR
jgi:hypothetical protein